MRSSPNSTHGGCIGRGMAEGFQVQSRKLRFLHANRQARLIFCRRSPRLLQEHFRAKSDDSSALHEERHVQHRERQPRFPLERRHVAHPSKRPKSRKLCAAKERCKPLQASKSAWDLGGCTMWTVIRCLEGHRLQGPVLSRPKREPSDMDSIVVQARFGEQMLYDRAGGGES